MEGGSKRRFWPVVRVTFRWCRILALFAVFLVISGLVILNQGGLPAFLRSIVIRELEVRGIHMDYQNLRLGLNGSVIADRVSAGILQATNAPRIGFDRLEVKLSGSSLLGGKLMVTGLSVRKGRVDWKLSRPGETTRGFVLSNVVASLRLMPGDRWEVDQLDGSAMGVKFKLNASVTNISSIARRQPSTQTVPDQPGAKGRGMETARFWLDRVQTLVEKAALQPPSEIRVMLQGDAMDPGSFSGRVSLVSGAGSLTNAMWKDLLVTAQWNVRDTASAGPTNHVEVRLGSLKGDWGLVENVVVNADLSSTNLHTFPVAASWNLTADRLMSQGLEVSRLSARGTSTRIDESGMEFQTGGAVELEALNAKTIRLGKTSLGLDLRHGRGSGDKLSGTLSGRATGLKSDLGALNQISFSLKASGIPRSTNPVDASLGYWGRLAPWELEGGVEIEGLDSPRLQLANSRLEFDWKLPKLAVRRLDAQLYGGGLESSAGLDVTTRAAWASAKADFDIQKISSLLTTNSQRWIAQFAWERPPKVEGSAGAVFPAWTNARPAWREEVLPTVWLSAFVSGTHARFRGIPVLEGSATVGLTNLMWQIPRIEVRRPEGGAVLGYQGHMITQQYHWTIDSSLDPLIAKPLLESGHQKAFDHFRLGGPPRIRGHVWGVWNARERSGVDLTLEATNLTVRGCHFQEASTHLVWTNSLVVFHNTRIQRIEGENASIDRVAYDASERMVTIEGGRSRLDAMVVAPVLGDRVPDMLSPYRFEKPPDVVASGRYAVGQMEKTEIVFDISGEHFSWWRLKTPKVSGRLTWRGHDVIITGLKAVFAQGNLEGDARFHVVQEGGAKFSFESRFNDLALNQLVAELTLGTNRLGGLLNGTLNMTSGQTTNQVTWTGHGEVELRDGFLWDIPLFGIFSPVLNAIVPGMGSARLHSGVATYQVSNRQVHTDDLEIRSPAMRLQYRGDVDFDGKVAATAMAEVLRDAWGVGRVFSLALMPITKLLEYKVSGTLSEPKSEPLYIPRFLTYPLRPLKTLREFLPDDAGESNKAEKARPAP